MDQFSEHEQFKIPSLRIVFQELLKGGHDLAPFEIGRRAVLVLSRGVSAPGRAAGEGARDHLSDHSHTGVYLFRANCGTLSRARRNRTKGAANRYARPTAAAPHSDSTDPGLSLAFPAF